MQEIKPRFGLKKDKLGVETGFIDARIAFDNEGLDPEQQKQLKQIYQKY